MTVKKSIDYSAMFTALDNLMATNMPQIVLYMQIGKVICSRLEKGAAVAAAEYLHRTYSGIPGFSPRNVRRMREFYATYQHNPVAMALAMEINWTQSVVIFEMCTSEEERIWYMQAVRHYGWSKQKLVSKIEDGAYLDEGLQSAGDAPKCEQSGIDNIAHSTLTCSNTRSRVESPCEATADQLFILTFLPFFIQNTLKLTCLLLEGRAPPD